MVHAFLRFVRRNVSAMWCITRLGSAATQALHCLYLCRHRRRISGRCQMMNRNSWWWWVLGVLQLSENIVGHFEVGEDVLALNSDEDSVDEDVLDVTEVAADHDEEYEGAGEAPAVPAA